MLCVVGAVKTRDKECGGATGMRKSLWKEIPGPAWQGEAHQGALGQMLSLAVLVSEEREEEMTRGCLLFNGVLGHPRAQDVGWDLVRCCCRSWSGLCGCDAKEAAAPGLSDLLQLPACLSVLKFCS